MSNRFASLGQYHRLILGHGIIAAIVFLLVVPSAIVIARFYYRNPRLALRLHIWLQILTVGLLTVVFILGFNAVGPERSLTNPHHGIGVALYTLVLVQALGGGLVHHFEKGKMRWRLPLKLMVSSFLLMFSELTLICLVVTPMARTSNCVARCDSNSPWDDSVWVAKVPFHPLCCSGVWMGLTLLHSHLHQPPGHRRRWL